MFSSGQSDCIMLIRFAECIKMLKQDMVTQLSSIRVQPNIPGAYPYQMPVPVAAMPIYGSLGGRFRLSCNNMLSPRLVIPKEISHQDLRHEINFVKDTTSDRQTFLKLFQYFQGKELQMQTYQKHIKDKATTCSLSLDFTNKRTRGRAWILLVI